ncbi:hypothetical protein HYDPIDRAFT_31937 [Hydnomerulius pinastri MD-312]|uniref:Unplaced genomic scaffold scaffold_35, whole genome shotgun sequence n=1 Tax=Hydnomerulius pinastri MD-312 TaxID=994086 RepID=A0A0C9WAV5_9AGAM|nr:hypothetical protein HYDPIDRAFT_31937 [Hydnomerulius pinastri MD-312]
MGKLRKNNEVAGNQHGKDINILDKYYEKNRWPNLPQPSDLARMRQKGNVPATQSAATNSVATNESDKDSRPQSKRHSKTRKDTNSADPMQLGFYPPKWKDFLEECKIETCTYTAIHDPWPCRKPALQGFITDAITMTITKWRREECTLFEDLSSWCGEIRKAADQCVRTHYNLSPPNGSVLSKAQTCKFVQHAASTLIQKSAFAHGDKDTKGHTNNFGHPAIQDLLHVFLYSRDTRIGNLHPEEFGRRVPNGTLSLGLTAVSLLCPLHIMLTRIVDLMYP